MEKNAKKNVIRKYRSLSFKEKSSYKKSVIELTGWSESTFQYKMRKENLSKLEIITCEKIMSELKV
jgi:hypothetical protein